MVLQTPFPFAAPDIMNAYWLNQGQFQGLEILGTPEHLGCRASERSGSPASTLTAEKIFSAVGSSMFWSRPTPEPR